MENIGELREAADVYEHGWFPPSPSSNVEFYILDGVSVRLANPTNNDAKIKLAEIYEIMDKPRKALDFFFFESSIFSCNKYVYY